MEEDEIFYNNEEKLNFIIDHLKLDVKEIEKAFGYKSGYVSKLRSNTYSTLKPIHFYAFESAYGIPRKIFTDRKINSSSQIIAILKPKIEKKKDIFEENEFVFEQLVGKWYAYVYPGNPFIPIYCIETIIHPDYTITDENNNYGQLLIGELQSLFIKKAINSKNFISILFDNADVGYELFHFSMLSKSGQVKREMCNFGFFSRKKIDLEIAKTILGKREEIQLKIDFDLKERVAEYAVMV
jgi:hypothetical protein